MVCNILKILSLFLIASIVGLTACTQQKQNETEQSEHKTEKATAKVDVEKASSEVEVEIPASVVSTDSTAKSSYPTELIKLVKDAQVDCKKSLGVEAKDVTQVIDLIGDDRPEYIYQPDQIYCAEDSVFRGHGGDALVIYSSDDGKKITPIFDETVFAFQVLSQKPKAIVQIEVGGGYCGQDMSQISRAEAINCKRNLVWDATTKKLEMGEMQFEKQKSAEE